MKNGFPAQAFFDPHQTLRIPINGTKMPGHNASEILSTRAKNKTVNYRIDGLQCGSFATWYPWIKGISARRRKDESMVVDAVGDTFQGEVSRI